MTAPMKNITKVTIEFGSGEILVMEPGMEVDFILGVATNVQKTKEGFVVDIPYVVTGRGDILRRIFLRIWERNPILHGAPGNDQARILSDATVAGNT